ncbi:CBS domain-containing protein [[Eubacterium] cellulosolvens]
MKIQIKDTIITDEYAVMTKTNDLKKLAKKIADSPNGVVIVKGRDSKILGVVTFKEIINILLSKKNLSKLKFDDVIQKKIMIVNDTDEVDKIIQRINRRKPVATIVVNKHGQLAGYFSASDLGYAKACQTIVNNILK